MRGACPFVGCRLLIVTTLLMTVPAQAETLEDAWREALAVNHSLKAVRENSAAAAQQLKAAEAARWPGVSFEAGYTSLDNEPASKATLGTASVEFPVAQQDSLGYKMMATLPLYTSGRISNGIDASSASLEASRASEQSNTLDLKLKIAEAFVSVLRAGRGLEVASSHVNSLAGHASDAQNMYDQGLVARNDLLAAQVALANARQQMSQAKNGLDLARSAYNYLLGRPLGQDVSLNDLKPGAFNGSLEILTERAITQRSELMAVANQVTALHHQASGIRASGRPQIALKGGYVYQENRYQVHEEQWLVALGLQWKLFDGGVVRHQASAVERQAAGVQEQHNDLVSAISLQVRQAWLGVQESRERIQVTMVAIDQANENLKVTRDRYESGLSNSTEVLGAETLRTRSQSNLANARYDLVLAGLRLKRAVGDL